MCGNYSPTNAVTRSLRKEINLPWFNHSLKRLARRKQRLYNKAKTSGKQNAWKGFLVARKQMHKRLKEAREAYISDYLGEAIEENPKRFWSYIKQLNKEELGIADFEINGSIISDNKSKCLYSRRLIKHPLILGTTEYQPLTVCLSPLMELQSSYRY